MRRGPYIFKLRWRTPGFTWKRKYGEARAEGQYAVAQVAQVHVVDGFGAQHNEHHHEHGAVGAVVQVAQSGRLKLMRIRKSCFLQWVKKDNDVDHGFNFDHLSFL